MEETIEFLTEYFTNIDFDIIDDKLVINQSLVFFTLNINFDNCIINGDVEIIDTKILPDKFLFNTIVAGNLILYSLKQIPKNFLKNTNIYGNFDISNIDLVNLTTLVNMGFPNVRGSIALDNLDSVILKDLLEYPGIKRELGFNLLKNS